MATVDYAILCEQIRVSPEGAVSLDTLINAVVIDTFPTTAPPLSVHVKLSGESGEHVSVQLILADPNGQPIGATDESSGPLAATANGDRAGGMMNFTIADGCLSAPGLYSMNVFLCGTLVQSLPLHVRTPRA